MANVEELPTSQEYRRGARPRKTTHDGEHPRLSTNFAGCPQAVHRIGPAVLAGHGRRTRRVGARRAAATSNVSTPARHRSEPPGIPTRPLRPGLSAPRSDRATTNGVIPRKTRVLHSGGTAIVGNSRSSRGIYPQLWKTSPQQGAFDGVNQPTLSPTASDRGAAVPEEPARSPLIPRAGLSTSERDGFVPTLSTLIHRRSQGFIPSGGQLHRSFPTDVDEPWGNRCGQTQTVTGLSTACGRLWISC